MDIERVNEFNFSNEEVEEFTSIWGQSLVDARIPSNLQQKTFDIVYEPYYIFSSSFGRGDALLV